MTEPTFTAFRPVPRTGVIFVTAEATRRGFDPDDREWCNLGQGQPETGDLPGAPPRVLGVEIDPSERDYAPVAGVWELREQVASLYNGLYRRGMPSQYSAENVAISGGGRSALTRVAASLGQVNLGHFLPDYTAYEELLDVFRAFTPIPILLEPEHGYSLDVGALRREIAGRGLSALLLSNPCNPTGKVIGGDELGRFVGLARELDCALVIDEFYSHYVWQSDEPDDLPVESAARFVEHVDRDPVVLLDGLTKNWRYPGWRVAWTVGPKHVIDAVTSAGSFLDGGGSRPLQHAAIPLLEARHVAAETRAIAAAFRPKRARMIERLRAIGIRLDREPEGTFYVWGDLSALPPPLDGGMALFEHALARKVITVPGVFFDVNPGRRRSRGSRFSRYARFSFGPGMDVLERACDRLAALVREHGGAAAG
ncbi:MAG TPA: pyridoxal phosphate-dependent aminotransferase [Nannocystaceae bacterium]|nr:pyridoxal phosphate-dependent aminotransferase [Nannocystaceae bacterium]